MVKVDKIDRKILYQLDVNSRQSFSNIGRKIGLSKKVVSYRIEKLKQKGIITRFYTTFDYLKLGYIPLRFYFKYQYVTPEIKKKIIENFVNCKYATVVFSIEGSYDLAILMLVHNIADISTFWRNTLDKYGDYFVQRVYSNYIGESIYRKSFLLDMDKNRMKEVLKRSYQKAEYDEMDIKILRLLSIDSRMQTIEIAKKLESSALTISNRIKKMIKNKIILGFKVDINWVELGYQWFKIDFFLKEYNKKNKIIKYIEKNPHLVFVDDAIGYADLELEFFLRDVNHLQQIVENIADEFPKTIRNYTYFNVIKQHKHFIIS